MNNKKLRKKQKKELFSNFIHYLESITESFSFLQRVLFVFLSTLLIGSALALLWFARGQITVEIPSPRGIHHEGVLGIPATPIPAFAKSQPDLDLVRLLYAGLLKRDFQTGELVGNLAESFESSAEGKVHTVTLKDDLTFHDGEPITSEDVKFTFDLIQNPLFDSPLHPRLRGAEVKVIDKKIVTFTLAEPFSSFPDELVVGIMPKHIWLALEPSDLEQLEITKKRLVGSGPFKLQAIEHNKARDPERTFNLIRHKNFHEKPNLTRFVYSGYVFEEELKRDLRNKTLDGAYGIDDYRNENNQFDEYKIRQSRLFSLIYQPGRQATLQKQKTREAIGILSREALSESSLSIETTSSFFPSGILETETIAKKTTADALALLKQDGWVMKNGKLMNQKDETMKITITTSNIGILNTAGDLLSTYLQRQGIDVIIESLPEAQIVETTIPNRSFDILLFGRQYIRDTSAYSYWHSSQRKAPFLNLANYARSAADTELEKLSKAQTTETRNASLLELNKLLKQEHPASPLFETYSNYLISNKKGVRVGFIQNPEDRFLGVETWYNATHRILAPFVKK